MKHTHIEKHFNSTDTVRDIVIGMSDGLTVPFALAAGLSGAVDLNRIVLTAGFAEIAAGAIAMGLGGYLAARTDMEHFISERAKEARETDEIPEVEAQEVADIFRGYGLDNKSVDLVVGAIRKDKEKWIDFMMKFELGIERPDEKRARNSAITIAASYIAGGVIPLSPYFFAHSNEQALVFSSLATGVALFLFGYFKGKFTVAKPMKSAFQTLGVGGLAAFAAYSIAKLIS